MPMEQQGAKAIVRFSDQEGILTGPSKGRVV